MRNGEFFHNPHAKPRLAVSNVGDVRTVSTNNNTRFNTHIPVNVQNASHEQYQFPNVNYKYAQECAINRIRRLQSKIDNKNRNKIASCVEKYGNERYANAGLQNPYLL